VAFNFTQVCTTQTSCYHLLHKVHHSKAALETGFLYLNTIQTQHSHWSTALIQRRRYWLYSHKITTIEFKSPTMVGPDPFTHSKEGIGSPPLPLPQASVPPLEPKGRGGNTRLRVRRRGGADSDDWRESLSLCILRGSCTQSDNTRTQLATQPSAFGIV
jgi:hypothetical protein